MPDPFPALLIADAVAAWYVSPWMPVLMAVPFVPWAWLISSRLEKDARYFHFKWQNWNAIHLVAGFAALIAMLAIPIFWVGWPVGMIILLAPILTYWKMRNESVPEAHRYRLSSEGLQARAEARRAAKAHKDALITFIDAGGDRHNLPTREDEQFPVHMLAEDLIGPALDARAYRVDVNIQSSGVVMSQMVDGVRYKREAVTPEQAMQLVDYLKTYAGLDVQDRRRQQSGEFKIESPSGRHVVSMITAGTSNSQLMRLEFDRADRLIKPFDGLGLLPAQIESLKSLTEVHDRHGIVLLGAPSGQGLSTSMYSFIGRHDAYTANIKTLEREVLLEIDGVDHVQWDPSNPDVDFATNLQSMLRRDPDIVMTGFIKDADTARVVNEPGMQGPLIYIPIRAANVPEMIREWVKVCGNVREAVKALRAVVNQRLIRSLCPNCRQGYQPTPEQLRKLNLPADKVSQLYRASGKVQVKNKIESCPVCNGIGYLGQTGVFEVMIVDDEVRKVLGKSDLKGALALARRNKMIYLQEAALAKVVSGETTIEEVVRITTGNKAGGEKAPASPQPAASS
jgi:type II secretory ATPase GspE/PulE/Tfp pilus assembly ATPase PilB-like protein